MRDPSSQSYVGLDVGTSAVRYVVGMVDPASPGDLSPVIGTGGAQNLGMRKGVVVHVDDVVDAIVTCRN